jgi:hypothetical protein
MLPELHQLAQMPVVSLPPTHNKRNKTSEATEWFKQWFEQLVYMGTVAVVDWESMIMCDQEPGKGQPMSAKCLC